MLHSFLLKPKTSSFQENNSQCSLSTFCMYRHYSKHYTYLILLNFLQHPFEVATIIIPTSHSKESESQRSLPEVMQLGFKSRETYCRTCPFTLVFLIILEIGFEILRPIYFIKTSTNIFMPLTGKILQCLQK